MAANRIPVSATQTVLVLGEALVDLFDSGPQPGGAPFNVARSLAGLGLDVRFVSRIGQDSTATKAIRESAALFGLSMDSVQLDLQRQTGTVAIEQVGEHHTFRIANDSAWDYIDSTEAQRALAGHVMGLVYFGTLAQRHRVSRYAVRSLVSSVGALRYLDLNLRDGPDNRALAAESMALADWMKVNDEELLQLLRWFAEYDSPKLDWISAEFRSALYRLVDSFQLNRLIVTRGPLGYASFNAAGTLEAEGAGLALPSLVDTVGAGDAFSALLIAAHLRGHDLSNALSWANAYASEICCVRGPLGPDASMQLRWRQRIETI